ncbi:MAG TPA: hypothetical protein VGI06_14750 [Acidimicrobiales bacterium]
MDLEPLPPEPGPAPGGGGPDPAGHIGRHGWSRRTTVGAAALALAVAAVGGWAVGTTIHSGGSTVRFQAAATVSGTGHPGTAPATPRARQPLGLGMGTVTGTPTSTSFTVSRPVRPAPSGSAAPSTTTQTVTVDVTPTTTYQELQSATGTATGLVGDRIAAAGSRVTGGALQATSLLVLPAPAHQATNPPASKPAGPGAARALQAPFVIGVVTADTGGVLTVTSPWGPQTVSTGTGTTVYRVVAVTESALKAGDRVQVQGKRQGTGATNPTVTATRVTIIPAGMTLPRLGPFGLGGFGDFGPGGMGGPGRRFGGGWRGFAPGSRGGPGSPAGPGGPAVRPATPSAA